jgi:hypothetical protein
MTLSGSSPLSIRTVHFYSYPRVPYTWGGREKANEFDAKAITKSVGCILDINSILPRRGRILWRSLYFPKSGLHQSACLMQIKHSRRNQRRELLDEAVPPFVLIGQWYKHMQAQHCHSCSHANVKPFSISGIKTRILGQEVHLPQYLMNYRRRTFCTKIS